MPTFYRSRGDSRIAREKVDIYVADVYNQNKKGGDCVNNEVLNSNIETEESKNIGMRWYKFITYFWFPFVAVINVLVAVVFIPGVIEKIINAISVENIELRMYLMNFLNVFNDLKAANLVYFFGCIVWAVYRIYISVSLYKFKKTASKHISALYILSGALSIAYFVLSLIIIRESIELNGEVVFLVIKNIVQTTASTVIWLLIYKKYFRNRKHLFIN